MDRTITPLKEAHTPEEMRAAIFELSYDDPLVKQLMGAADFNGLSSEDRYTALAYYALKQNQILQDMVLKHAMTHPGPWIIKPGD